MTTNKVSTFYDKHHSRDNVFDDASTDRHKKYLGKMIDVHDASGLKILEAGGIGSKAVSFQLAGSEAHHIDLADSCVNYSRKYGVNSVKASIGEPHPNYELYFDAVICDGVIHHTENPSFCLNNIANWVTVGGYLFLSVYNVASTGHLAAEFGRAVVREYSISLEQMSLEFDHFGNVEFIRTQKRHFLDHLFVDIYGATTRKELLDGISGFDLVHINDLDFTSSKIEIVLKKKEKTNAIFTNVSPSDALNIEMNVKSCNSRKLINVIYAYYMSTYLRSFHSRMSCIRREKDILHAIRPYTPLHFFRGKMDEMDLLSK